MVDADLLKRVVYFSELNRAQLESIGAEVSTIVLDRGSVLMTEGQECPGLCFVISGSVKCSNTSPQGREQVFSINQAHQTFGEVPVLDGGPTHFTATAVEPSEVGLAPVDMMRRLIQEHTTIAEGMLRVFAERIRSLVILAADLTHLDVTGRIAKSLVMYHASTGHRQLNLRQQDLASIAGTTREVAARALRSLEDRGCIRRRGRTVEIVSQQNLAELLWESAQ